MAKLEITKITIKEEQEPFYSALYDDFAWALDSQERIENKEGEKMLIMHFSRDKEDEHYDSYHGAFIRYNKLKKKRDNEKKNFRPVVDTKPHFIMALLGTGVAALAMVLAIIGLIKSLNGSSDVLIGSIALMVIVVLMAAVAWAIYFHAKKTNAINEAFRKEHPDQVKKVNDSIDRKYQKKMTEERKFCRKLHKKAKKANDEILIPVDPDSELSKKVANARIKEDLEEARAASRPEEKPVVEEVKPEEPVEEPKPEEPAAEEPVMEEPAEEKDAKEEE